MSAKTNPEDQLIDDIAGFYEDPLGFVLYAFDWQEGEGPDDWQRETLDSIGKAVRDGLPVREATASGHGVGKSALVAWVILWAMSTRPHLAAVVTANTEAQLKHKTWRELSIWHKRAINKHWFTWTATKFHQTGSPETWFVSAIPWSEHNPEAFAGLHGHDVLVVFDEASAIPDVIWETTEGAMTTDGAMWMVFGNPTRNTGRFRECFGKFRHRWNTRKIDSRRCVMVNQRQVEQWLADYGEDSDFFKVRVRGEFPSAAFNQLIPVDVAEAAMERVMPLDAIGHMPRIWGLDIARYGDDMSVLVERQGRAAKIVFTTAHCSLMALANKVADAWTRERPDAVFVDDGGVGGGVTDRLRELNYTPIAVNFQNQARDPVNYANIRAQMWFDMAAWLAEASIPNDSRLRDDLVGPEYGFDRRNRRLLESKEDMKRRGLASPDYADGLALTFAAPVAPPDTLATALVRRRRRGKGSWSPHDWMDE